MYLNIKLIKYMNKKVGGKFSIPSKIQEKWTPKWKIIEWIYSQWKWDFWFVDVVWLDKWYFVFWNNAWWAFDWDKVKARVKIFKWKSEAVILDVIERKQELIVWKFQSRDKFGFVIPNNKLIKSHIFVPGNKSMDAKDQDIVWVQITKWTGKNPEWTIREILWKTWDKKIDLLSIIIEWWARLKFWNKISEYLEKFKSDIPEHIIKYRKDLTELFTFTIDWEDAKDLDDAISIEKLTPPPHTSGTPLENGRNENYKLYVHIADVSYYVIEKSELDIEAYKRATSIYLVDRVIPMLPEKLSNDLCSLNPNTNKLTLTCEMLINNNWKIIKEEVYESVINSNYRLTYKEIDEILTSPPTPLLQEKGVINSPSPVGEGARGRGSLTFWWKVTNELIEKLKISDELKEKITNFKKLAGVLNFDFPETKIELDEEGNLSEIKMYPRYNSNKIIEEFMISANESVSKKFSSIPFLYRIHEEPKDESLINLQKTLNLFEINFVFKKGDTKEFSELLKIISKQEQSRKMFLEKIILRTLSKAVYSKENFGHFWLWLSFYSHFTSPIRRYPDLQIHRIIKEKLAWKLDKKRLAHYESILEKVSNHTSDKERKAEKLEYKVRDYYIVKYYKDKIWEEFDWVITWVIPKWFFVWLKNTAEWFVELTRSDFNEELQEHTELKTWNKYRLWDKIRVKLIEADEQLLRLNFEIIQN